MRCIALAPHMLLSEETERELAIRIDLRLLEMCREVWVCGDRISEGTEREIAHARETGIPVRFIKEEEICTRLKRE